MVWSKKSLIADRSCSISEDFPKDVAYRRKKLFPIFAKGRKTTSTDKKSLSLKADVLIPAVGFSGGFWRWVLAVGFGGGCWRWVLTPVKFLDFEFFIL